MKNIIQTIHVFIVISYILINLNISLAVEYPALPQIFMETNYNPPTTGKIISANNSVEFQSALTNAKQGDIIELKAGVTFTGPFTLPYKTNSNEWIYIRSSAYSNLPKVCTRVSPTDSINMPKIVVKAGLSCIITSSKAHHFRFVGIEFKPLPNSFLWNVIYIGNGEKTVENLPNNIVFDRCFIHGDSAVGSRRGILMNGNYIAVIDSYISDCKEEGADSQALASYNAIGPFKIVNNYLEGAGENVMFGGADPSIPNAVMADIEIRCNYFFKPLSWINKKWSVKNLIEFKNAKRVLVEGNKFENCWINGQVGFAWVLTPRNQNNTANWSTIEDITMKFNTVVNVAGGVNLLGYDSPNQSQRASRILIQNNVFNVTNVGSGTNGRVFQILSGPTDVIFDHNTTFCNYAYIMCDGKIKTDNFVFTNNIVNYAKYGFIGTGTANANTTLSAYFNPNWQVLKNAIIEGTSSNYPAGNYFPKDTNAVGFVNYANGDYHLITQSFYKYLGTDGKDLGADIDSIDIMSTYKCDTIITSVYGLKQATTDLVLYPNPVTDILKFNLEIGYNQIEPKIQIFTILGIKLFEMDFSNIIDVSFLKPGLYFVVVGNKYSKIIKI